MKTQPDFDQDPHLESKAHEGTPHYGDFGSSAKAQAGTTKPANQPKKPRTPAPTLGSEPIKEAQIRAAYAKDDPRYAGGNVFDLRNEQTTL